MFKVTIGNRTRKLMAILNIKTFPFSKRTLVVNFRGLAKIHHSDKKGGDDEMMKKITAAYSELLPLAVEDVTDEMKGEANLKRRNHKDKDMFTLYESCKNCNGSGFIYPTIFDGYEACYNCNGVGRESIPVTCNVCKGTGKFTQQNSGRVVDCLRCNGTGIHHYKHWKCWKCNGTGKITKYTETKQYCPKCNGTGKTELKVYNPVIPKGAIL